MPQSLLPLLPLVIGLPLAGVVVLVLVGGWLGGRASAWLATALVGAAFLLAAGIGREFMALEEVVAARAAAAEAAVHPAEEAASASADAPAPYDQGPRVILRLWRWMSVRLPLSALPAGTLVPVTVATGDIQPYEVITADNASVIMVDASADPAVAADLAFVWDRDALLAARLESLNAIPAGSAITSRLAPPFPAMMQAEEGAFRPVRAPSFTVDAALRLDALSLVMLLVVTGVGLLIHLYSIGYMAHDPDRRRYFAYLNLFVASMLVLVLGDNFLVLFVGWELVGACSYLLIGFWHADPANAAAGKKAFVVNRVGDLAFLVALMLIWTTYGSLAFGDVLPNAALAGGAAAVAIPALLLVGATGKSAQLPLHVWLPDAMAGPTPVSALIHAATMVTAGIYLIARVHPLFEQAPAVMAAVAIVGAATALMAALIALTQVDIKRVLAYSTISQLGYMFLAMGAGAYAAGIFHLVTHAFFKALLFLGAGSLMHAMEHGFQHAHAPAGGDAAAVPAAQDMRQMGGLLQRAPITGWTFVVGGLALAGLFPLSGFFSKDAILHHVLAKGGAFWTALFAIALFTAFLTACYAGRQLLLVLWGAPRSAGAEHAAESPAIMTVPLVLLALLAATAGLPAIAGLLDTALATVLTPHHVEGPSALLVAVIASAATLAGLGLAFAIYAAGRIDPARIAAAMPEGQRWAAAGFHVDALYGALFVRPFVRASSWLWRTADDRAIDGAVNAFGRGAVALGQASRRWQTGQVRRYALSMLVGAAAVVTILALR